jgi:hypothetical protein
MTITIGTATDLIKRLRVAKIYHTVAGTRAGAITVHIVIPGERWEVDFCDDGTVDVERFVTTGQIEDGLPALEKLLSEFSD